MGPKAWKGGPSHQRVLRTLVGILHESQASKRPDKSDTPPPVRLHGITKASAARARVTQAPVGPCGDTAYHTLITKARKVKVAQLCPTLRPRGLYRPWNSPGQNTGVGSLSLLQWIFPTQESNWGLLHCRRILYQLSYEGSPITKAEGKNKAVCSVDRVFQKERKE